MALVFRRWKVLLVLNLLAAAGFLTFWARCNSRLFRSGSEVPDDGRRPRSNGTGHEALLKRLGSLEDVVYRQLNGTGPERYILISLTFKHQPQQLDSSF